MGTKVFGHNAKNVTVIATRRSWAYYDASSVQEWPRSILTSGQLAFSSDENKLRQFSWFVDSVQFCPPEISIRIQSDRKYNSSSFCSYFFAFYDPIFAINTECPARQLFYREVLLRTLRGKLRDLQRSRTGRLHGAYYRGWYYGWIFLLPRPFPRFFGPNQKASLSSSETLSILRWKDSQRRMWKDIFARFFCLPGNERQAEHIRIWQQYRNLVSQAFISAWEKNCRGLLKDFPSWVALSHGYG